MILDSKPYWVQWYTIHPENCMVPIRQSLLWRRPCSLPQSMHNFLYNVLSSAGQQWPTKEQRKCRRNVPTGQPCWSAEAYVLGTVTFKIFTSWYGLSFLSVLTFSICWTTSIPFTTLPNTVCLLSSHGVATVVIKNWEPLVLGPALAMERVKGLSCLKLHEKCQRYHYIRRDMRWLTWHPTTL